MTDPSPCYQQRIAPLRLATAAFFPILLLVVAPRIFPLQLRLVPIDPRLLATALWIFSAIRRPGRYEREDWREGFCRSHYLHLLIPLSLPPPSLVLARVRCIIRPSYDEFSVRLRCLLAFWIVVWLLSLPFWHMLWMIDDFVYPNHREERLDGGGRGGKNDENGDDGGAKTDRDEDRSPARGPAVFVTGGFRTGSTGLHEHLLRSGGDGCFAPTLFEIIFPFLCVHAALDALRRRGLDVDGIFNALLWRVLGEDVMARHFVAPDKAEEDDWMLATYMCVGWFCMIKFPDPEASVRSGRAFRFDGGGGDGGSFLSEHERRRMVNFYLRCLQKVAYHRRRQASSFSSAALVNKTHLLSIVPSAASRLRNAGDDVVAVHIVRHPDEAASSWCGLSQISLKALCCRALPMDVSGSLHKTYWDDFCVDQMRWLKWIADGGGAGGREGKECVTKDKGDMIEEGSRGKRRREGVGFLRLDGGVSYLRPSDDGTGNYVWTPPSKSSGLFSTMANKDEIKSSELSSHLPDTVVVSFNDYVRCPTTMCRQIRKEAFGLIDDEDDGGKVLGGANGNAGKKNGVTPTIKKERKQGRKQYMNPTLEEMGWSGDASGNSRRFGEYVDFFNL